MSVERGHAASAVSTIAANASAPIPSTRALTSTSEPTTRWPLSPTSSITIVTVTSSRSGGKPAPVSSPATDIVMQPPWAAASSSSGLVFPCVTAIRLGSENGSSENAPVLAAVSVPSPRARFPSQTTAACRSIRGT
jgi:hypothetical protein